MEIEVVEAIRKQRELTMPPNTNEVVLCENGSVWTEEGVHSAVCLEMNFLRIKFQKQFCNSFELKLTSLTNVEDLTLGLHIAVVSRQLLVATLEAGLRNFSVDRVVHTRFALNGHLQPLNGITVIAVVVTSIVASVSTTRRSTAARRAAGRPSTSG